MTGRTAAFSSAAIRLFEQRKVLGVAGLEHGPRGRQPDIGVGAQKGELPDGRAHGAPDRIVDADALDGA